MKKRLILVLLLACFFFSSLSCSVAYSDSIRWHSYKEGLAQGKKEGKKIFLHFYTPWCRYCKTMARETFKDPSVISYLNENYIPIKVDVGKKKNSNFNIIGVPDTWFMTEDGEKIANQPGHIPPDRILNILKFIHTDSYKKMSFKAFLKSM